MSQVLITGGTGAIGAATAKELIKQGDHVTLTGRRAADHPEVTAVLKPLGDQATYRACDVGDPHTVWHTISEINDLRAVIFAAGLTYPMPPILIPPALIEATIDTNLKGLIYVTQAAIQSLSQHPSGGVIVHVGSMTASAVDPENAVYAATKAAGKTWIDYIAFTYATSNIRATTLELGVVKDHGMAARHMQHSPDYSKHINNVPLQRFATTQEVAQLLTWMIGPQATYITGNKITYDGGATLSQVGPPPPHDLPFGIPPP